MAGRDFRGLASDQDSTSEYNRLEFVVQSILGRVATSTLVRVVSVTNAGTLDPVGFVDVNPLIAQLDGNDQATPHGVIHKVPYVRIQGGANAIIMDPQVGDIGVCVFASHDISAAKVNKGPSNPGSRGRFRMADALYVGAVLNGVPEQYIRFSSEGVEIKAPTIKLIGSVEVTGTMHATMEISTDVGFMAHEVPLNVP